MRKVERRSRLVVKITKYTHMLMVSKTFEKKEIRKRKAILKRIITTLECLAFQWLAVMWRERLAIRSGNNGNILYITEILYINLTDETIENHLSDISNQQVHFYCLNKTIQNKIIFRNGEK